MAVARIVQQFITLSGKAVEYLFWQAGSSGRTSISWGSPKHSWSCCGTGVQECVLVLERVCPNSGSPQFLYLEVLEFTHIRRMCVTWQIDALCLQLFWLFLWSTFTPLSPVQSKNPFEFFENGLIKHAFATDDMFMLRATARCLWHWDFRAHESTFCIYFFPLLILAMHLNQSQLLRLLLLL